MNRLFGVLLMVAILYGVLMASDENARGWTNQKTIAARLGFYGILTVGVGVLILSGGIDLSIGSVVGLGAVCFGLLLEKGITPWLAVLVVLVGSLLLGLIHGLLVTKLGLQPFLVTLCGLFIYRGVARMLASGAVGLGVDQDASFRAQVTSFRDLFVGEPFGIPQQLVLLVLVSILLGLFLHGTIHGRYLFAIGANEDAARYAGVSTDRYKILAYIVCSGLAGVGAVLEMLETRSTLATNAGQLLELYAITGAVLGGCSLRGGEGTIPGMFLGAAVLPLLRQLCSFLGGRSELDYVVIGFALLLGTMADELLKRQAARRAT
jgi:ribose transport system permease protein